MATTSQPQTRSDSEHELAGLPSQDRDMVASESQLPPADGGRQANITLLACCIIQLPVWGKKYAVF